MHSKNKLSAKTRYLIWRANFSIPGLLARFDEKKVVSFITAINAGLAILVLSLFAWLTDLPLAFPALGPSAFILFSSPLSIAAAPRNVIMGHWISLATGLVVWNLVSYCSGAPVSLQSGSWPLLCSASLTMAISSALLLRLSCPHPPACASGLVVGLGAIIAWPDLLAIAAAVVCLTYQAYATNRLAGLPVPVWAPRNLNIPAAN